MRMSCSKRSSGRNGNNGGGRGAGGPAPFLVKTHRMVEEEGSDDVISWGAAGASFVVWKPVEFARDLLPVHFKHNNFSSFVRQLNTYGFRKVVPDRWEFANENFRRGEQGLLCKIHRRKAPSNSSSADNKSKNTKNNTTASTSTSPSSSSTSSPPPLPSPLPPPSQHFLDLSYENEKLKKDNQVLAEELVQAKQQCEQLLSFLSKHVSKNDIDASLLAREAELAGVKFEMGEAGMVQETEVAAVEVMEEGESNAARLKLFGVLLKGIEGEKNSGITGLKRGWCEEGGGGGGRPGKMCFVGGAPWMGMASPVRESSKVCN